MSSANFNAKSLYRVRILCETGSGEGPVDPGTTDWSTGPETLCVLL